MQTGCPAISKIIYLISSIDIFNGAFDFMEIELIESPFDGGDVD